MKIICIGRNYKDHAKELNNPIPSKPVFFLKPDTAILKNNAPFYHPDFSSNIHHEIEVVIKIKKSGKYIDEKFAKSYFDEFTLGLDLTARDLQSEAKSIGLPWEIAKAFDHSAVIGDFIPIHSISSLNNLTFELHKNQIAVQKGNTSNMIFSFSKIISYISTFITLKTGDLIFTGTPEGVGKISIGDSLSGYIDNKELFKCLIK